MSRGPASLYILRVHRYLNSCNNYLYLCVYVRRVVLTGRVRRARDTCMHVVSLPSRSSQFKLLISNVIMNHPFFFNSWALFFVFPFFSSPSFRFLFSLIVFVKLYLISLGRFFMESALIASLSFSAHLSTIEHRHSLFLKKSRKDRREREIEIVVDV